jgi:hypothetical protein
VALGRETLAWVTRWMTARIGGYSPELLPEVGLLLAVELLSLLELLDDELSEPVEAGLAESDGELDESDEDELDEEPEEVFAVVLSLRA